MPVSDEQKDRVRVEALTSHRVSARFTDSAPRKARNRRAATGPLAQVLREVRNCLGPNAEVKGVLVDESTYSRRQLLSVEMRRASQDWIGEYPEGWQ